MRADEFGLFFSLSDLGLSKLVRGMLERINMNSAFIQFLIQGFKNALVSGSVNGIVSAAFSTYAEFMRSNHNWGRALAAGAISGVAGFGAGFAGSYAGNIAGTMTGAPAIIQFVSGTSAGFAQGFVGNLLYSGVFNGRFDVKQAAAAGAWGVATGGVAGLLSAGVIARGEALLPLEKLAYADVVGELANEGMDVAAAVFGGFAGLTIDEAFYR